MRLLLLRIFLFLVPAAIGILLTQAQQSTAPAPQHPSGDFIGPVSLIHPTPAGHVFPNGETYVYSAEWRIWDAGTITLGISSQNGMQRVNGSADSRGVVSALYPVHDRFDSLFDPKTFCSQSIRKHTEEGFRSRDTLISFDYGRRKSVLDETNLKKKELKHVENDIPGCVSDVLSGLYYVRSLPLMIGSKYTFPLNDGNKTVDVTVLVEGKETLKTPAGTFPTIRVAPDAAMPLSKKGKIQIWYSDDTRRIPVQMKGRMFWGTLTFKLLRIEQK